MKLTRKYEIDRIGSRENILSNCIVNTLIKNEGFSKKNICGRIPIFQIFYDMHKLSKTDCLLFDINF